MTSAECLAYLKGKEPEYCKGIFTASMQKILIENLEDASARARRKEAYANPSSTVHLLTDLLTTE